MMSLTFGLFTQVSGSGPLGPLVQQITFRTEILLKDHFRTSLPLAWSVFVCGSWVGGSDSQHIAYVT